MNYKNVKKRRGYSFKAFRGGIMPRKPQVGVWITTDGKEIEVHPKDGKKFSLGELQEFVGGYIERVTLPNGRSMFVNEEGKLKGLKTNIAATIISGLYPHDVISGPAFVLGDSESILKLWKRGIEMINRRMR
jgi:hypothetical protein